MDAPPAKENSAPFVDIAGRLQQSGLHVPQVFAVDLEQGFLLLGDLGSNHYLDALNADTVNDLYGAALDALLMMQLRTSAEGLPDYDEALLCQEMALFPDWLLGTHLGLGDRPPDWLAPLFEVLVDNALQQSQVFVHRDYHSRNLLCSPPRPGIIDFQDAVRGPCTYDLVSLLKDSYIRWPRENVLVWVRGFHQRLLDEGINSTSAEDFIRHFDLMGVQRQLKVGGIFARLCHRDGKPAYLADIPRTLNYVVELAGLYPELEALIDYLNTAVLPALEATGP